MAFGLCLGLAHRRMVPPELRSMLSARVTPTMRDGVYRIRGSLLPWRFRKAENEKAHLVETLARKHPHVLLWLNDWNDDLQSALQAVANASVGTAAWYRVDRRVSALMPELYQGAWGAFFFSDDRTPPVPPGLPMHPEELAAFVREVGAECGISSWYDDAEWLVFIDR